MNDHQKNQPPAGNRSAKSSTENSVIRVLVVDDHKVVREGLASLLAEQEAIEVVG